MIVEIPQDAELERLHAVMATLPDEPPPPAGADVSAAEWLARRGATPKMLAAAEACYANDFGASLRQLGLREMIAESRAWDSGAPRR